MLARRGDEERARGAALIVLGCRGAARGARVQLCVQLVYLLCAAQFSRLEVLQLAAVVKMVMN